MYYSQQGEDRFLYENYLNYREGFFIELGAMDGITFSNTLFFENTLEWKGILIEPTNQFELLVKNRPNTFNFNCAISEINGDIEFLGNQAIGGIKKTMPNGHLYGWKLNNENPYYVKSKPIGYIINEVNLVKKVDRIDFFSIDVEGGELEVLKTHDWSIPTYLILIEISKFDIIRDEECREFLRNKNFRFECEIGCNEIWINESFKLNK